MQASPGGQVKRFAWDAAAAHHTAHEIYKNQTAQFPLSFTLVARKLD